MSSKLSLEEKQILNMVVSIYGTQAKKSDIYEAADNAGLNKIQTEKIVRIYEGLSRDLGSWIRQKLEEVQE